MNIYSWTCKLTNILNPRMMRMKATTRRLLYFLFLFHSLSPFPLPVRRLITVVTIQNLYPPST